ncbi:MAG: hypothetical protein ACF8R9_13585 [Phycisphaerales bacterium JB054]
MSEQETTIALVGHCRPDSFAMRSALGRYAPGAVFVDVNDSAGLASQAGAGALLVNRVLDGRFGTGSGLELIGSLPEAQRRRATLISNLPEAQAEAVALGAVPGFGKSEMYSDKARETIEGLVGARADG